MKKLFYLLTLLLATALAHAQGQYTETMTVTNSPANIVVHNPVSAVVIRENSATPTAVFSITPSASGSAAVNFAAGGSYIFSNGSVQWGSGTTIGTIQATTAGPFTFVLMETNSPIVSFPINYVPWFSLSQEVVAAAVVPISNTTGNTYGEGFMPDHTGLVGHICVDVATADTTAGHNYEFGILGLNAAGTDLVLLAHTTPTPTAGTINQWWCPALNQNVLLNAGTTYVLAGSVSTGNTAQFFAGFSTPLPFLAQQISASNFPASGYTVPTISWGIMNGAINGGEDFGLYP